MERNEEITDGSRKPTIRQIEILEQLSKHGELNPNRLAGIINILNWSQNSNARNKRKQQKDLMLELSLNQRVGGSPSQASICSSRANGKLCFVFL
jgi:hypothetical protein